MTTEAPYTTALMRTALALADAYVICDVESEGRRVDPPSDRRWDVSAMFDPNEHSPEVIDMAEQAMGYGVMRGVLELDTTRPWTVRILRTLP